MNCPLPVDVTAHPSGSPATKEVAPGRKLGRIGATTRKPDAARPAPQDAQWQAIEVRHLAALGAVAYEGSFRRAAEQLGYVQSAISGQIAHLEQAVGMRLLDRASGTPIVTLTDAGRVLLRHTEEILARFETAYDAVSSLANRAAGTVRVAGLERLAPRRQAEILSTFRDLNPFARVVLEEPVNGPLAIELLGTGKLDLLVSELPLVPDELVHLIVEQDTYVLLVSTDSPLGRTTDAITAAELGSLRPMIPAGCIAHDDVETIIRTLGLRGRSPLKPESVAMTQALVANGLGDAIVPLRLIDPTDSKTVTVKLPDLLPSHTIVLAVGAGHEQSPALCDFIEAICQICDVETVAALDPRTRRAA